MKRIGCSIEQELFKQMKIRCIELSITMTEYLIHLIKKDLESKKDIQS